MGEGEREKDRDSFSTLSAFTFKQNKWGSLEDIYCINEQAQKCNGMWLNLHKLDLNMLYISETSATILKIVQEYTK